MGQPTTNSIADINSKRILVINWPDEICTFVNEVYDSSTGILTILYNFVDKEPGLQPQENKFSLNSFDTTIGNVTKVVFRQVSSGRPGNGGPNSITVSNPSA